MTANIILRNSTKTGKTTQIYAAFKLSLCVSFLIIVIMLSDSWFIILISDPDLQGQLIIITDLHEQSGLQG